MLTIDSLRKRFYSGSEYDGTSAFYNWIRQYLAKDSQVLNLGAGPATRSPIRTLKGEVASIVGADVDRCVLGNDELDRAVMIEDGRLPLPDASFDVVFSDYVLEHVEKPAVFLAEAHRVLKPGGSFFLRTPNAWHYVALISAATPHWFHQAVANRARRNAADAQEPWPTYYRLNTPGRIRAAAAKAGFAQTELRMIEAEPSYLQMHPLLFLCGIGYERLVNATGALSGLRANIFGRIVK